MLRPAEKTALERSDAPVLALGDDGLIGYADAGALRALGWDASLVGRPTRDVIPPERLARHKQDYRELSLGHWPNDGMSTPRTFRGQDGRERLLHCQVAVFRRPDGSLFLCAAVGGGPKEVSLRRLATALESIGYKRLTPEALA